MRKEWILSAVTGLITLATALSLLRWIAPQLLGMPLDLQLVQASQSVPPFYENVFREQDLASDNLVLQDPSTNIRFRPLLPADNTSGPHDILGFRNEAVPNNAAIIVFGDSQTYGIGEPFAANWPSQLAMLSGQDWTPVYNMAIGGWGAVQYLDMFSKAALRLHPRAAIVAFYSGNDPLESFITAYGNPNWETLRLDPALDSTDAPKIGNLLSMEDAWPVKFTDGTHMVFTPAGRLAANDSSNRAVRAGYAIIAEVARRIGELALQHGVAAIFTIIPTRELVYAEKVMQEGLTAPEDYRRLVGLERENIEELAGTIRSMPGSRYVDLLRPLQTAALSDSPLYPRQWDGHPGKAGYAVIARTLAAALEQAEPALPPESSESSIPPQ